MGWAVRYIEKLQRGETVSFRPHGHSMTGKINDGQLVTVQPLDAPPSIGDAVLCRVKGNEYVHLVKAVQEKRALIGNNKGGINGWTALKNIFGKVIAVE
jgi:SOS-response transcriptional repressor LexA